jgi:spermidine/putrescine transport system substrate-binding protein
MVVLESSQNKDAAYAFIDFILEATSGKAVTEFTFYKVPNAPGAESVDPAVLEQFPTLAMPSSMLFAQEPQVDLGADGITLWTDAVTQVKAGCGVGGGRREGGRGGDGAEA